MFRQLATTISLVALLAACGGKARIEGRSINHSINPIRYGLHIAHDPSGKRGSLFLIDVDKNGSIDEVLGLPGFSEVSIPEIVSRDDDKTYHAVTQALLEAPQNRYIKGDTPSLLAPEQADAFSSIVKAIPHQ